MKKNMKKITSSFLVAAMLVFLGFTSLHAFAEDNKDGGIKSDTSKQEVENGDKSASDGEMDNEQEQENESSLHDHFNQVPDVKTTVTLPEIDSTKINTYADVVTLLNQYKDTVNQIENKGNTVDLVGSSLSEQEKAILSKITQKHSFELSRTSTRANEILAQIKDLSDLLSPLGTQNIATEFNLKGLLISQLNDFSSMTNDLTNLTDSVNNILDEETN